MPAHVRILYLIKAFHSYAWRSCRLKHSWSYAIPKHIRTDMKLLEVTMIYAGKDGTKEELLVLRAHQELWEWNVAAPLSRWFWYVLILSGSDGLSGIATPSVIELVYIAVRTSIFINIYIYYYTCHKVNPAYTRNHSDDLKKERTIRIYWHCLYLMFIYWTWLDFVFFSLFIMYICDHLCVCFFVCIFISGMSPDMISHCVLISTFSLMGCFLAWCLQHFDGEGRWRAQYVCPVFTQRTLRLTSSARRYVSRWGLALWSHGKNVKVLGTDRLVLQP